ncbi:hypothetical protein PAAG_08811 [Paracoccidioides lutzii Pb01]|uniref:Uncharacterized protein n=1 Tax=Paracoccidioides lutzii (strain ATCC MYA-826 / Pb01) TaxID=502779 RepID=C1HDH0_PARBA|nr:hypothetical protein PAAG_08811 [Paracoccidioides lutzii Pb01]EEH39542.2 hypothetical protein PAAG_08811 [Paracoccidioides lutzii Pb01]
MPSQKPASHCRSNPLQEIIHQFTQERSAKPVAPIVSSLQRPTSDDLDHFHDSLVRDNKRLKKNTIEHPMEWYLMPGDLSEPSVFARMYLYEHGLKYGGREEEDGGHLNDLQARSLARAARTPENTSDGDKMLAELSPQIPWISANKTPQQ